MSKKSMTYSSNVVLEDRINYIQKVLGLNTRSSAITLCVNETYQKYLDITQERALSASIINKNNKEVGDANT